MKKKKFVSKYARINTLDFVLSGFKRVGSLPTVGVELKLKNHSAMDTVIKGTATTDHIDVLIASANMAEAMAKVNPDLGSDWLPEIKEAQQAIKTMAGRGLAKKRFLFTGPEMTVFKRFMAFHDVQLDTCTVQEMESALKLVQHIVKNGLAEKIVEMA